MSFSKFNNNTKHTRIQKNINYPNLIANLRPQINPVLHTSKYKEFKEENETKLHLNFHLILFHAHFFNIESRHDKTLRIRLTFIPKTPCSPHSTPSPRSSSYSLSRYLRTFRIAKLPNALCSNFRRAPVKEAKEKRSDCKRKKSSG